jgi:membrane protease YdiL (CAAX protease family)
MSESESFLPERHQVPWRGWDLLAVLAAYILSMTAALWLASVLLGPEIAQPPVAEDADHVTTAHPVVILLLEQNIWISLFCAFSAIIVAPITEEFFFRVLLQGWLEAEQSRLRARKPVMQQWLPGAVGPIVLTSLLFAGLHIRGTRPAVDPTYYLGQMMCTSLASLATMGFAIGFMRFQAQATAADLGLSFRQFFADVRLGIAAFLVVGPWIFALYYTLLLFFPQNPASDPIPLFFFALVLGYLYNNTHRLVPSMVTHALLNASSLAYMLIKLKMQTNP